MAKINFFSEEQVFTFGKPSRHFVVVTIHVQANTFSFKILAFLTCSVIGCNIFVHISCWLNPIRQKEKNLLSWCFWTGHPLTGECRCTIAVLLWPLHPMDFVVSHGTKKSGTVAEPRWASLEEANTITRFLSRMRAFAESVSQPQRLVLFEISIPR